MRSLRNLVVTLIERLLWRRSKSSIPFLSWEILPIDFTKVDWFSSGKVGKRKDAGQEFVFGGPHQPGLTPWSAADLSVVLSDGPGCDLNDYCFCDSCTKVAFPLSGVQSSAPL